MALGGKRTPRPIIDADDHVDPADERLIGADREHAAVPERDLLHEANGAIHERDSHTARVRVTHAPNDDAPMSFDEA